MQVVERVRLERKEIEAACLAYLKSLGLDWVTGGDFDFGFRCGEVVFVASRVVCEKEAPL